MTRSQDCLLPAPAVNPVPVHPVPDHGYGHGHGHGPSKSLETKTATMMMMMMMMMMMVVVMLYLRIRPLEQNYCSYLFSYLQNLRWHWLATPLYQNPSWLDAGAPCAAVLACCTPAGSQLPAPPLGLPPVVPASPWPPQDPPTAASPGRVLGRAVGGLCAAPVAVPGTSPAASASLRLGSASI